MAFSDNFDRADEDLTASADWTLIAGEAGAAIVSGNQLGINTSQTNGLILSPDEGTPNHYVEYTLREAFKHSMVVVRATDENNFIGHRGWDNKYSLYKMESGTLTLLADTFGVAANDVIRVECNGDTIKVYANGVERLSVTESFNNTATRQGISPRGSNPNPNPWIDSYSTNSPGLSFELDGAPIEIRAGEQASAQISSPATVPTTGNVAVKLGSSTGVAATINSVTGSNPYTVNFTFPKTTNQKFNAEGYLLYLEVGAENVLTDSEVPYLPETNGAFGTVGTPDTNADVYKEYSGGTWTTGDQYVYDTLSDPSGNVVKIDNTLNADILPAPTTDQTIWLYRIAADGTKDVDDTITFDVVSGLTLGTLPSEIKATESFDIQITNASTAPTTSNLTVRLRDSLGPAATVNSVSGSGPWTASCTFVLATNMKFSGTGYPLYVSIGGA